MAVLLTVAGSARGGGVCDLSDDGRVNLEDFCYLSQSWTRTLAWGPDGPPRQLLAHWRLDGNAEDNINIYTGTVCGSPDWLPKSGAVIGNGAVHLGGGDYIAVEDPMLPALPGSFTLDLYVKTTFKGADQVLLALGNGGWRIGIETGTGFPYLFCPSLQGPFQLLGSTDIADNQWHHLSGVYDHRQQALYLYLDGRVEAQAATSNPSFASEAVLWIGGNPDDSANRNWFYGSLDNIRIFTYALGLQELYASRILHVDQNRGNDNNGGEGRQSSFKTIQAAIDVADHGDLVLVWPGVYEEALYFDGKAITVRSIAEAAVLTAPDDIAVTFMYGEQQGSVLENFIIRNCYNAIMVHASSPTLRNLTIVENVFGIDCWANAVPTIVNSILWNNSQADLTWQAFEPQVSYSCLQQEIEGAGNISVDPLFADPNQGDYHLQSQTGRYVSDGSTPRRPKPEHWVIDAATSPCIDAGRPTDNPMNESMPNGGRINMGAYGGTSFAGQSPWGLLGDLNFNGRVDVDDLCLLIEHWEPGPSE